MKTLALAALVALAAAFVARPDYRGRGLHAVHSTGLDQIEQVALVTANGPGLTETTSLHTAWDGVFYQPEAGRVTFRVPRGVAARLTLDGEPIYETTLAAPLPAQAAPVELAAGFHPIHLEITTPRGLAVYYQAGLEWRTPLGWRLVPPAHLYPEAIDPAQAQSALRRWQLSLGLGGLALLLGLAWLGREAWVWRRRLASPTALALIGLAGLAFGLRLLILQDLTAAPNADVIPLGSDHRSYQETALKVLRGTWKEGGYRVQPGMTLALAGVYALLGPDIRAAQAAQMLLGSLATILAYATARRIFGRGAGWWAALLWATFPLAIFYEAQVLTHGLEAQAGLLVLWLWVRALEARTGRWVAALGLALGASSVLRPTFLALAPIAAVSLAWRRPAQWGRVAGLTALLGVMVALPIAPITWRNYVVTGEFQLISSNSDLTLYLGNNRDATGLGEYTPAYWATHARINRGETGYLRQTLIEIRAEPGRWAQLMIRKTALYLGGPELPNNVDFYLDGAARSPLLAALPARFGALMALALAGAALALAGPWRRDGRLWAVLVYAGAQAAVTVAYHVFSRFRAPIYPALVLLGGYAIAGTLAALRGRDWRDTARRGLAIALSAGVVALMPPVAEGVMTRPIDRALPASSLRLDAPIGEALTLVGYDAPPAIEPGEPVFVTLYWQASEPLAGDLFATVQVLDGPALETKITQTDQELGTGSYPDYPPEEWQPGQIVHDRYLLLIPSDAAAPRALTVLVAAYHRATGDRVGERAFGPLTVTYAAPLDLPADAVPVRAQVGSATLAAYTAEVRSGALKLTLYWQGGAPMSADATVFVHLLTPQGALALGQDGRPMNGLYGTQSWQAGEGIVDEHTLALADLPPGDYSLEVGMYDTATQERLPVVDANGQAVPEGVVRLGSVTVR